MVLSIPEKILFALVLVGTLGFCVYRGVHLYRLLRLGKAYSVASRAAVARNAAHMLADVLLHRHVLRKPVVGILHAFILYGFIVFSVNTVNHFAGAFLPGFSLLGGAMLARAYTVTADVFALLLLVGAGGLAFRRYVLRPPSLTPRSVESALVFIGLIGAMGGYLWVHAHEIALGLSSRPESHVVARQIARLFAGIPEQTALVLAHAAWWVDGIMHLLLLGIMFYPTKHLHLLAGPINLLFRSNRPRGHMTKLDLEDEEAETFGVARIGEFTWKQNLDLMACIECGRCQDFCPTYNSGKPLRPKHLIVDMRTHLLAHGTRIGTDGAVMPALIGEVVQYDAIWACTTCGACVEHCPMGIEHVDKLTDMRQYLTLMESNFPESATTTFRNMETAGNPWGFPQSDRAAWADGLDVPLMSEKGEAEILFWVGCSGSYDDRNKKVAVAVAKILLSAGVDFAILGNEERCNCESARRLGNELLYQTATSEIVETLGRYRFQRILVICPHCMNTLRNEYPDFGGEYEVVHHTEFIEELLAAGKLRLNGTASHGATKTVFHDSCYLGRINGVYDAPRSLVDATGSTRVGVPREREKGFCCGAGGGRMWLEETLGEPINGLRVRELLASGADEIAASCPFCITMLSDAAKRESDGAVPVLDVAELVARRLDG